MTVDEYLVWAEGRPGRYELYAGSVYAMAPERAGHAETKFSIQAALLAGIKRAGLPFYMLPDGMTVRIDETTAHEPDALVYCGEKLPRDALEAPNPIIVVEVLSPSTRRIDASAKLAGYFPRSERAALSDRRFRPAPRHSPCAERARHDRNAHRERWRAAARPAGDRDRAGGYVFGVIRLGVDSLTRNHSRIDAS